MQILHLMHSIHTHAFHLPSVYRLHTLLPDTSDTTVTRFAPTPVALAVVKVVVAMTARDASGIGGAHEIVVARFNDAISAHQLETRWAVLDTLSVDLLVTLVALAIVKVVVACAAGNAARVHWADIVGALHRRTNRRSDGMIGRQADWRSDGMIGRQADRRNNWLGRRRNNWLGCRRNNRLVRRRNNWLGRRRNNRTGCRRNNRLVRRRNNWLGRRRNNWTGCRRNNRLVRRRNNRLGRRRNNWVGRRRSHWLGRREGNRWNHGSSHGRRNWRSNGRRWRWRTLGVELIDNLKACFSPNVALNLDSLFSTSR
jgi:hypothetical protein